MSVPLPREAVPTAVPNAVPRRAAAVRGPIRLPASRRFAVYAVAAGVWVTGALWLVFHHFVRQPSPFGPEPSPLEPWWLRLHGAAAMAAVWIFGLLWGVHALNGWNARRRRWSGGVVFGLFLVLIATGWLLYYAGSEDLRSVGSLAHWVLGLAAPVAFLWHRFLAERSRRPRAKRTPSEDDKI